MLGLPTHKQKQSKLQKLLRYPGSYLTCRAFQNCFQSNHQLLMMFGVSRMTDFPSKIPISRVFEVEKQPLNAQSDGEGVSKSKNTGNGQRMMKNTEKLKIFCSEAQFPVLFFLLPGFWAFANIGPGLAILAPPPPQSPLHRIERRRI